MIQMLCGIKADTTLIQLAIVNTKWKLHYHCKPDTQYTILCNKNPSKKESADNTRNTEA